MSSDIYESYLQSVRSLVALAKGDAASIPTFSKPTQEGSCLERRGDQFALLYVERGAVRTIATGDLDVIAFHVLRSITFDLATAYERDHRRVDQDSRRQWMHDHVRRMAALRPEWGEAVRDHYNTVLRSNPFDDVAARRTRRIGELTAGGMVLARAREVAYQEFPWTPRDVDRCL